MKIRTGFVSNSSASSFFIYGISLSRHAVEELGAQHKIEEECTGDILDRLLEETDLTYNSVPDGDYYIGLSLERIKDDETGLQFKERVAKGIEKVLGKPAACQYWKESYWS